jgi:hypothetical protein
VSPAEPGPRLARVTEEGIDLGRAEITRITSASTRSVDFSKPFSSRQLARHRPADVGESPFDELAQEWVSGCKQIVVGLVLLQHEPHSFGEVARVVSIAFDVEVAQQQLLLQAVLDRRNRPCDLAVTKVSPRIGLS